MAGLLAATALASACGDQNAPATPATPAAAVQQAPTEAARLGVRPGDPEPGASRERASIARSRPTAVQPGRSSRPADIAAGVTTDVKKRPELRVRPTAAPPRRLARVPVVQGTGEPARDGQLLTIRYTASTWSDGRVYDDLTWDHPMPFTVVLGDGDALPGLERGLRGMRVGERRLITVPPRLGYRGDTPAPVSRKEGLVFVVDLLRIERPSEMPKEMSEKDRRALEAAEKAAEAHAPQEPAER